MDEIKLPEKEYISYEKDGRKITVCTLRQKALHIIGLDGNAKPYTRHGKRFYRPYRNYFDAPKAGDKDLDRLAAAGYLDREITHPGTDREGVWYSYNRAGLDWLGKELGITIYGDDEDDEKAVYESIAKSHAWNYMGYDFVISSKQLARELEMPRSRVLKALHKLAADGMVKKQSLGRPAVVSCGEIEELECEAMPPANGWSLAKKGYDTEYYRAEEAACNKSLADWANGRYDDEETE